MGVVDDYIASLPDGADRDEVVRLHRLILARVPGVGQATSYAMPCHTYRGVPVAAVLVRAKHIAWYPFSGKVLPMLRDRTSGYSWSPGTLRFTAANPLPDDLVNQLIDIRMRHVDDGPTA